MIACSRLPNAARYFSIVVAASAAVIVIDRAEILESLLAPLTELTA